jgi:hypothetical protein
MIKSLAEWKLIIEHGTSGDQVHDIIASWEAEQKTHYDEHRRRRLQFNERERNDGMSVDIKDREDHLLMRLNVFDHGLATGPSIDVIFVPKNMSHYLVQSWNNGDEVVHGKIDATLVSISRQ